MSKGKKNSANKKARYTQYKSENRSLKNKISKVKKHLKKHPEDASALSFIKNS